MRVVVVSLLFFSIVIVGMALDNAYVMVAAPIAGVAVSIWWRIRQARKQEQDLRRLRDRA